MKKIIFFDGDGTLWYPRKTRREQPPHWVYDDSKTAADPLKHMIVTPSAVFTLRALKTRGVELVILSTHPQSPEEASQVIDTKVRHFGLQGLFDEIHATRPYEASKGEFIVEILQRRGISKKDALMVGDMYDWDYHPAKENGVKALLIESPYRKEHPQGKRVRRTIKELRDVLEYI